MLFCSVMDEESPLTIDLQSIEYDTNVATYPNCEVAHPNCGIDPETEALEEGMLTNTQKNLQLSHILVLLIHIIYY